MLKTHKMHLILKTQVLEMQVLEAQEVVQTLKTLEIAQTALATQQEIVINF